jgi:folylpolyglutamate synthase/dihydropteroate synthase
LTPAAAALEHARDIAGAEGNVLVCGSLYLVGEILAHPSDTSGR